MQTVGCQSWFSFIRPLFKYKQLVQILYLVLYPNSQYWFFCCVAVIVGREPRGKNSSMQLHFLAQIKRFPGSFYRGGANGSFVRSAACCTYIRIGNWKCRHHVVKLVSPTVGYKWLLFFLIRGTDRRTAGAALYHTIPSWYQINSNLSRWLEMLDITFRIY